jgi:hypothetical protein
LCIFALWGISRNTELSYFTKTTLKISETYLKNKVPEKEIEKALKIKKEYESEKK